MICLQQARKPALARLVWRIPVDTHHERVFSATVCASNHKLQPLLHYPTSRSRWHMFVRAVSRLFLLLSRAAGCSLFTVHASRAPKNKILHFSFFRSNWHSPQSSLAIGGRQGLPVIRHIRGPGKSQDLILRWMLSSWMEGFLSSSGTRFFRNISKELDSSNLSFQLRFSLSYWRGCIQSRPPPPFLPSGSYST
jgi:hypothetical protein